MVQVASRRAEPALHCSQCDRSRDKDSGSG